MSIRTRNCRGNGTRKRKLATATLRAFAESKHKTDKLDARVLAEFSKSDMIPKAYRPSPRIRQYRVLVRHQRHLQNRMTGDGGNGLAVGQQIPTMEDRV